VYYEAWLEHFDELWTFNNHAAGACHAHVVLHHCLSDSQLATIRDSGVPIVCQVCWVASSRYSRIRQLKGMQQLVLAV
jgi:hypothetical protein